jgi:cell wall-associated NlpC family hydrolase
VDFDFKFRDSLPQTDRPVEKWSTKWGPPAKTYPKFESPDYVKDPVAYQRRRVIAVARKYLGLPYKHKHIPAAGGLDCSNFTSWVYNYGFGIRFSSHIGKQAETAGRRMDPDEAFEPGDLLFQTDKQGEHIAHVVIYIGENKIIDSTEGKVSIRSLRGWYKSRHSHARRIIE